MGTPGSRTVTEETIRSVLGHFPTGVVIVTAYSDEEPVGMTLQSFMSLSLDPPLVLLSVAKTSTSWPRIAPSGRFLVNILSQDQDITARQFSKSGADKFAGIEHRIEERLGGPLLHHVSAWVDCAAEQQHDGGDHVIIVARVLEASVPETGEGGAPPLIFHRSGFPRLAADNHN